MKGYAHPAYAESFAEFGTPRELPACGGWILERQIPGLPDRDAMGCYPLFVCRNWSQLHSDLKALGSELVSLSLVADPFGQYDVDLLDECFDIVIPFKDHFVADLSKPGNAIVSSHHRYYARKALKNISVDVSETPILFLDEWTNLYADLTKRFDVRGIRAFSKAAFARQLEIPGAVMFRALYEGTAVAAHVAYIQDKVCYGHLAGVNTLGQKLMASYALYWSEIEYFADKAEWLDWGAGVGIQQNDNDGVAQFKRGWSTGTRVSYFCGKIFDHEKYDQIVNAYDTIATEYFPAYRTGEFS